MATTSQETMLLPKMGMQVPQYTSLPGGNQTLSLPQVLTDRQEQERLRAILTAQTINTQHVTQSLSPQPILVNSGYYATSFMPSYPPSGNTQPRQPGNDTTGVAIGDPTQNPFYPYARRYVDEPALYTSFTNPTDPSGRNQLANQVPQPVGKLCTFPSLPDGTGYGIGGGCGFSMPLDATPASVSCAYFTSPGQLCEGGFFSSGFLQTVNAIRLKSFQQDNATKSQFLAAARPIIM